MDLFHKIEGSVAIVQFKGQVLKQLDLYARGERLFFRHSGGFLRICSEFGGKFSTPNPDIFVLEFEGDGIELRGGKEPRYVG